MRVFTPLFNVLALPLLVPAQQLQELPTQIEPAERVSDALRDRITESCRAALDTLSGRADLPGVSAALVLPDGTEIALTLGFASREDERPMAPTDRLLAGSIGKTYVTAAAHHLAIAGALALDSLAVRYFEGEDWFLRIPNAGSVTVRQLLRHQSGIPRYVFAPAFWKTVMAGEAFEGPYLDTMLEAVPARELGPGRSYGLGVIVSETDEGILLGHDGFMPGYVSSMGYFPEHGIAVAFQMNTDDGRAAGRPLYRWLAELAGIARRELEQ